MTEQTELFAEPAREPAERSEPTTPTRRRLDRAAAAVEAGQHPLAGPLRRSIPLHPAAQREMPVQNGPSCGTCTHRGYQGGTAGRYPKCKADGGTRATRGLATDVRASWPGCDQWEQETPR